MSEEKKKKLWGLQAVLGELVVEHMVHFGDTDPWEWALTAVLVPRQTAFPCSRDCSAGAPATWHWLAARHPCTFAGYRLFHGWCFSQGPL